MDNHIPVLYQEILDYLRPHSGGLYIDGTVGSGGHSAALLAASAPDGRILAFDRDPEALSFASEKLSAFGERIAFVQANFADMNELATDYGFTRVDGILLDLGLSSRQLADGSRGFSFQRDGPLDMRFDPSYGESAADLVNNLKETDLADIFWRLGEVPQSRKIAQAIVRERPIRSTGQLADIVAGEAARRPGQRGRLHPATRIFQALRIAVNDELAALEKGLAAAVPLLKAGGRLAVISFHSLEDRIVKQFIRDQSRFCRCPPEQPICTCEAQPLLRKVTRKVVRPAAAEVEVNPRSRSARLRVAQKA